MLPFLTLVIVTAASAASAAAPAGPPPYQDTLRCAAYSQAAAELSRDPVTGVPESKTFDHAMFWSFAVMDAARRAGIASAEAEAAQKVERAKVKPALASGDPAATDALQACLDLAPR